MCISNKIGPPVEGDDFFGRTKEIRAANRLLDKGHSLLLSAPRRIGKSSFAKKLIEVKKNEGWKCVYIDLEETATEDGFLRLVINAFDKNGLWNQVVSGISKGLVSVLEKIEKVSVGPVEFNIEKREQQEDLYKILKELIRHDNDTLIVVDELTLFLGILGKSEDGIEKSNIHSQLVTKPETDKRNKNPMAVLRLRRVEEFHFIEEFELYYQ